MFTSNSGHAAAGPAAHGAGPGQHSTPPTAAHANVHPHSLPMATNMNSAGVDINVFDQDLNFDESLLYVCSPPLSFLFPFVSASLCPFPTVILDCPHSTSHVPRARHMARHAMTWHGDCAITGTCQPCGNTCRKANLANRRVNSPATASTVSHHSRSRPPTSSRTSTPSKTPSPPTRPAQPTMSPLTAPSHSTRSRPHRSSTTSSLVSRPRSPGPRSSTAPAF